MGEGYCDDINCLSGGNIVTRYNCWWKLVEKKSNKRDSLCQSLGVYTSRRQVTGRVLARQITKVNRLYCTWSYV